MGRDKAGALSVTEWASASLLAGPDTSSRILTGAEDSAEAITSAFAGAWSWAPSDSAFRLMFPQIDEAPGLELRFGRLISTTNDRCCFLIMVGIPVAVGDVFRCHDMTPDGS